MKRQVASTTGCALAASVAAAKIGISVMNGIDRKADTATRLIKHQQQRVLGEIAQPFFQVRFHLGLLGGLRCGGRRISNNPAITARNDSPLTRNAAP